MNQNEKWSFKQCLVINNNRVTRVFKNIIYVAVKTIAFKGANIRIE